MCIMLFTSSERASETQGIQRLAREARPLLAKRHAEYLQIATRSILNRCSSERMP